MMRTPSSLANRTAYLRPASEQSEKSIGTRILRTNLILFIQSRASWQLTTTTLIIMVIGAHLPFSPLAAALGFVPLPPLYWLLLLLTLLCYVALTQLVKVWPLRKSWI
jgi:Mg2+-importing ATPase